jgi:hypothetical protein
MSKPQEAFEKLAEATGFYKHPIHGIVTMHSNGSWVGVEEKLKQFAEAYHKAKCEQAEPFGYFKAEPFGWTDCVDTDEGAIALYELPPDQSAEIERLKAQAALDEALMAESTRTIQELEAHINDLREALQSAIDCTDDYDIIDRGNGKQYFKFEIFKSEMEALAKTPAQSLQAHDDEVIERCAKVCDECGTTAGEEHFIRALKGKQNETA